MAPRASDGAKFAATIECPGAKTAANKMGTEAADDTGNLQLPYLMPSQAQKHFTYNEALQKLDALVHLAVVNGDLSVPPASPDDGECHIVGAAASGAWAGRKGQGAAWQNGTGAFCAPRTG